MIKNFVTTSRIDTPPPNNTTATINPTTRSKPPLLRFLSYVKPYVGLIVLATLLGVLRVLLPAPVALAIRFVTDHLVPTPGVNHDDDAATRGTLSVLSWITARLPANWGADSPSGQL